MNIFRSEEPDLGYWETVGLFFSAHWRGVLILIAPFVGFIFLVPFPPLPYQWCVYTMYLMIVGWVTECIPVPITSFLPVLIFPLANIMSTADVCKCYINDTIFLFLGSLILAYAVEHSGLHRRLAYLIIVITGFSHLKLLFAICFVTMFASMWITNTAATSVMIPIITAILQIFEDRKVLKIYEKRKNGKHVASDITTCYFCAATFSASIGGIGTIIGTVTNMLFKGIYIVTYPTAVEYLTFLRYSYLTIPIMLALELATYLCLIFVFLGVLRKHSVQAKNAFVPESAKTAVENYIQTERLNMEHVSFWEFMVIFLFAFTLVAMFTRSPKSTSGWADGLRYVYDISDDNYILDSAVVMLIAYLMFLLPYTLDFFRSCYAKYRSELPSTPIQSIVNWSRINILMPYSFIFILGAGFAFCKGAKATGLNTIVGDFLRNFSEIPNTVNLLFVIIIVVLVTNIASNVVVCIFFVPITLQLAQETSTHPLWYDLAAGLSSSFSFLLPIGTPGNLMVSRVARIPTIKMMKAGVGPTVTTILITWFAMDWYAPQVFPELLIYPPPEVA